MRSMQPHPVEEPDMAKRVMILPMSPFGIEVFLKPGRHAWEVVGNPLPEDAEILRFHYDYERDCFWLVLSSKEFAEVPEGKMIPRLPLPVIRSLPEPEGA